MKPGEILRPVSLDVIWTVVVQLHNLRDGTPRQNDSHFVIHWFTPSGAAQCDLLLDLELDRKSLVDSDLQVAEAFVEQVDHGILHLIFGQALDVIFPVYAVGSDETFNLNTIIV